MNSAPHRLLLLVSALVGFGSVLVFLQFSIVQFGLSPYEIDLPVDGPVASFNRMTLRHASDFRAPYRVFVLGNSVLMQGQSMRAEQTLPRRLAEQVRAQRPSIAERLAVDAYMRAGQGYTSYYFLAEQLAETLPNQVLIQYDLVSMSPGWRARWANADQVAYVGVDRILDTLALPIYRIGLNADRVVWTVAARELGALGLWRTVAKAQGQAAKLRDAFENRVADLSGSSVRARSRAQKSRRDSVGATGDKLQHGPPRLSREAYRAAYRDALAGVGARELPLAMTKSTVQYFEAHGIETTVFVSPINVEHMERVGALDPSRLQESLARLGDVVREAGGRFADFHDLLPDSKFRDARGHLTYNDQYSGTHLLAHELAGLVLDQLNAESAAAQ